MTAPRQVLRGKTYLVTRRCFQRQFLLAPSPSVNATFLFVLAVAARKFGVQVHAYCVLSNHFHLVVTDPDARLPAFEQYLDSLVARALNASMGRWESFWAPASYSAVVLESPQDIVDKAAYVLANPVAAGLVRSGRDWPGLWSSPQQIEAGPVQVNRPSHFFRPGGPMPRIAELELTCPPGFESSAAFREQLSAAQAHREEQARRDLARMGRPFLGREAVLARSPESEPPRGETRRGLKPRIAARDKWKRIEALTRLKSFLRAYREAWNAFRNGARDVVFPLGTYWLRVNDLVHCVAPG